MRSRDGYSGAVSYNSSFRRSATALGESRNCRSRYRARPIAAHGFA